jgi:hypothetical protein
VSLLRAASDRLPGMLARPGQLTGWTAQHLRHAAALVRPGANPAARVYESIGADFFLALAPGWLNLGLWEGPGSEGEAAAACRRLVATLASPLPAGGVILDVGNGLGTQDPVIRAAARLLLRQVELLWRRRIIDYLLIRAVRP